MIYHKLKNGAARAHLWGTHKHTLTHTHTCITHTQTQELTYTDKYKHTAHASVKLDSQKPLCRCPSSSLTLLLPLSTPRPHLAHLFCGVLHKKHMAVTNEGLLLRRIPDSLVCFRLFAWPLPSFNGELLGGAARDLALAATNGPYSLDNSPHSQS